MMNQLGNSRSNRLEVQHAGVLVYLVRVWPEVKIFGDMKVFGYKVLIPYMLPKFEGAQFKLFADDSSTAKILCSAKVVDV